MRAFLALALILAASAFAHAGEFARHPRQPVAAVLSADDQRLYVANEKSGTISIVNVADRREKVVAEIKLAERLIDLAASPDRKTWLALAPRELLRLSIDGNDVRIAERIPIDATAVRVILARDGRRAFVAGLWSRRVTIVDLQHPQADKHVTIDLPFAPRELLLVQDDARLIAADAFAGRLAVIDTATAKHLHTCSFPAHNIRGLGVNKKEDTLIVVHQMLNELGHTVENDVHWGLVMTNDLRWLRLATVLAGGKDLYRGAHMHPLGQANRGSGDPSGLAVAPDGRVIVTLGGVNQIALGKEEEFSLKRASVGQRPTRVVVTSDSRRAFVLNTFGDSLSLVDLDAPDNPRALSLGPTPKLSQVAEGERLFYDARLSLDGWMSCHSCHTDGHTNGQKNDNFSDKTFGAPKRVMSLLTTTDSAPFGWRGTSNTLAEQLQKSIVHTMQGTEPEKEQVAALAAYLQTLTPPPSIDAARGAVDKPAIARGEKLFTELKCARCHAPPAYTSPKLHDVGLKDELDHREFNPPSLLGVGQRDAFFHDSRATSLEAVFDEHAHQLDGGLEARELSDLVRFLRSL